MTYFDLSILKGWMKIEKLWILMREKGTILVHLHLKLSILNIRGAKLIFYEYIPVSALPYQP